MLEPSDVGTASLHLSRHVSVRHRDKLRSQDRSRTKTWVTEGWYFGSERGVLWWGLGHYHGRDWGADVPAPSRICPWYLSRSRQAAVGVRALFANLGLFAHFGFHMKIIGQHEHGHKIVVRFHLCIWGILWHCFESHLFGLWSYIQWLLAIVGTEFDSRCQWVVSELHVFLRLAMHAIFLQCNVFI